MNDIDFLNVLASSRLQELREKKAAVNMRQAVNWMDRHPHATSALMSGGLSAGFSAANATTGERMDAALRGGARGAVIGAALSHGMAKLRKHAAVKDHIHHVVELAKHVVKNNKPEIAGALIGGAAMGLMQYKASKKNPETGKSMEQEVGDKALDYSERQRAETLASGKQPGLTSDIAHGSTQFYKTVADSFSKHPVKGALMSVPAGASAGAGLARRLMK